MKHEKTDFKKSPREEHSKTLSCEKGIWLGLGTTDYHKCLILEFLLFILLAAGGCLQVML